MLGKKIDYTHHDMYVYSWIVLKKQFSRQQFEFPERRAIRTKSADDPGHRRKTADCCCCCTNNKITTKKENSVKAKCTSSHLKCKNKIEIIETKLSTQKTVKSADPGH
jgi:hypothetical protein